MLELPVTFRPEARDDLGRIFDHVLSATRSVDAAERFVRRIRDRCGRIGLSPLMGRPRDDLRPGLRLTSFERSVMIAYRIEVDRVEIVNVFGRGRDYDRFYAPGGRREP